MHVRRPIVPECPKFLKHKTDAKSKYEREDCGGDVPDVKNVGKDVQEPHVDNSRRAAGDNVFDLPSVGKSVTVEKRKRPFNGAEKPIVGSFDAHNATIIPHYL